MKTKVQNISVNTLFAASIGCFIQFALGIFVILSPFLLLNIIAPIAGQEAAKKYLMMFTTPFIKEPIMFMIGLIFLLILAVLFLLVSSKIKKNRKIQMWSIVSLVSSFLLLHFGPSFLDISAILGLIGSITGLMHKEETP